MKLARGVGRRNFWTKIVATAAANKKSSVPMETIAAGLNNRSVSVGVAVAVTAALGWGCCGPGWGDFVRSRAATFIEGRIDAAGETAGGVLVGLAAASTVSAFG